MLIDEAIGRDALIRLRDWLNTTYPDLSLRPGEQAANHPKHGDTYRVVQYKVTGRTWFRVIETDTGNTAVRPVGRKHGVKLDFFLSFAEAWRTIDQIPLGPLQV